MIHIVLETSIPLAQKILLLVSVKKTVRGQNEKYFLFSILIGARMVYTKY